MKKSYRLGFLGFRGWALVVLTTFTPIVMSGCDGVAKPSKDQEGSQGTKAVPGTTLDYKTLRQWQPNGEPDGLGLEILLEQEVVESEVVQFIEQLSAVHSPVMIRVYTSRVAYQQE